MRFWGWIEPHGTWKKLNRTINPYFAKLSTLLHFIWDSQQESTSTKQYEFSVSVEGQKGNTNSSKQVMIDPKCSATLNLSEMRIFRIPLPPSPTYLVWLNMGDCFLLFSLLILVSIKIALSSTFKLKEIVSPSSKLIFLQVAYFLIIFHTQDKLKTMSISAKFWTHCFLVIWM